MIKPRWLRNAIAIFLGSVALGTLFAIMGYGIPANPWSVFAIIYSVAVIICCVCGLFE